MDGDEQQPDVNPGAQGLSRRARIVLAGLIVLSLVWIELVVRFVFPIPEISNFNRITYSPTFATPHMKAIGHLSNDAYVWPSKPDGVEFVHRLNLYGFRDMQWEVSANSTRVIFIGDSFVEGMMTESSDSIPLQFRDAASRDGVGLEVLNMGVAAAGTPEYVSLMRDTAPLFQPDAVVVVFYANDIPGDPIPDDYVSTPLVPERNSFWVPRLVELLSAERIITRWGTEPFDFFQAVPHEANPWSRLEKPYSKFVSEPIATAMKAGEFNPYSVEEYNNIVRRLEKPFNIRSHIEELKRIADANGVRLQIVYIPSRHQVSEVYGTYALEFSKERGGIDLMLPEYRGHVAALTSTCAELGISFVDTTSVLREMESGGTRVYWNYDPHMRAVGYQRVGELLYEEYSRNGEAVR